MFIAIIIIFFICLAVGVPIAFSLGGFSILWSLFSGNEITLVARRMFYGVDSFTLLAVPLFMLSGSLMNNGNLSARLVEFCRIFFGRVKGGLAYMNVLDSMIFAGMSGSSQADTASIGSIMIKQMDDEGYPARVTMGVTCASSTIGVIIPPSIPMLVLGAVANVSVAGMFMGGILPGLIVGVMQMIQVFYMTKKYNFPSTKHLNLKESLQVAYKAIPSLMIPLIILGGTGAGVFTSTEAGVICVFYSLIVGVITKQLSLKVIWSSLKEVAILSSLPLLICSIGFPMGWILAFEGMPAAISAYITGITTSPVIILTIVALIVLFLGCFVDNIVIITIMVPILLPVATAVGINPIQFAIVVVVASAIGLITPPVGQVLFVASSVSKRPLKTVVAGTVPFLIGEIIVLAFLVLIPQLSTLLPALLL
jgi:tripartite ATP-independent transporter DctM subunit